MKKDSSEARAFRKAVDAMGFNYIERKKKSQKESKNEGTEFQDLPINNLTYILEELTILMGCIPQGLNFNKFINHSSNTLPLFLTYPLEQPPSFKEGKKQLTKLKNKNPPLFDMQWLGINLTADNKDTPAEPHYCARFHNPNKYKQLLGEQQKYLLFLISVNRPYHRDQQLIATINLFIGAIKGCVAVAKQGVNQTDGGTFIDNAKGTWHILVVVADSLQAYNKAEDELHRENVKLRYQEKGLRWKNAAEPIFSQLVTAGEGIVKVEIEYIHWEELLTKAKSQNYQPYFDHLIQLYNSPETKQSDQHTEKQNPDDNQKRKNKENDFNFNQPLSFSNPEKKHDRDHQIRQQQLISNYIYNTNAPLLIPSISVEREDLIKQAKLFFSQPPSKPLCLHGTGGAGKTHFASYIYHFMQTGRRRFWIKGNLKVELKKLEQSLVPSNKKKNFTALKNWFEKRPGCLIIFDDVNYKEIQDFNPKQTYIVYTSRKNPSMPEITSLEVPIMDKDQAITLLKKISARYDITGNDFEILVEKLGGLPLALEQAAAYLRKYSTITAALYLREYKENLEEVINNRADIVSGLTDTPVFTTHRISLKRIKKEKTKDYAALTEELLRACAYLASNNIPLKLLNNWFNEYYSEEVEKNPAVFEDLIKELVDHSLLKTNADAGTVSIHPVMQDILRWTHLKESTSHEGHANFIANLANSFLNTYISPIKAIYYREHTELLPHLTHVHKSLRSLKNKFSPNIKVLKKITLRLGNIYQGAIGNPYSAIKYFHQALKLNGMLEHELAEIYLLLSDLYQELSGSDSIQVAIRYITKALQIYEAAKNTLEIAHCYNLLAENSHALQDKSNIELAITYAQRAQAIYETLGKEYFGRQAKSYEILAKCYSGLGHAEKKFENFIKFIHFQQMHLDSSAARFFNIANNPVLSTDERYIDDYIRYLQSLEAQYLDNPEILLILYTSIAMLLTKSTGVEHGVPALDAGKLGKIKLAITYIEKGIALLKDITQLGSHRMHGDMYTILASYHSLSHNPKAAREFAKKATEIYEENLDEDHPSRINILLASMSNPQTESETIEAINELKRRLPNLELKNHKFCSYIYHALSTLFSNLLLYRCEKKYYEEFLFFSKKSISCNKESTESINKALVMKPVVIAALLYQIMGGEYPFPNSLEDTGKLFIQLFKRYNEFFAGIIDYRVSTAFSQTSLHPLFNREHFQPMMSFMLEYLPQTLELARACVWLHQLEIDVYEDLFKNVLSKNKTTTGNIGERLSRTACEVSLQLTENFFKKNRQTFDGRKLIYFCSYLTDGKIPMYLIAKILKDDFVIHKKQCPKTIPALCTLGFSMTDMEKFVKLNPLIQTTVRGLLTDEDKKNILSLGLHVFTPDNESSSFIDSISSADYQELKSHYKKFIDYVKEDLIKKYAKKLGSSPHSEKLKIEKLLRIIANDGDSIDELKFLLIFSQDLNIDLNSAGPQTQKTALRFAAEKMRTPYVLELITAGARCDLTDKDGKRPFDEAGDSSDPKKIEWLLSILSHLDNSSSSHAKRASTFLLSNHPHFLDLKIRRDKKNQNYSDAFKVWRASVFIYVISNYFGGIQNLLSSWLGSLSSTLAMGYILNLLIENHVSEYVLPVKAALITLMIASMFTDFGAYAFIFASMSAFLISTSIDYFKPSLSCPQRNEQTRIPNQTSISHTSTQCLLPAPTSNPTERLRVDLLAKSMPKGMGLSATQEDAILDEALNELILDNALNLNS